MERPTAAMSRGELICAFYPRVATRRRGRRRGNIRDSTRLVTPLAGSYTRTVRREVCLSIAECRVGILAEPAIAQLIEGTYAHFLDVAADLRLAAEPFGELARGRPSTARCTAQFPALELQSSGLFSLHLDRATQHGVLRFALPPPNWYPGRVPAGIEAALKALLAVLLAERGGLLLHASAVDVGGVGVAFVGPSGAGKSTISSMFGQAAILNDELLAVVPRGDDVAVHATPFRGTADHTPTRRALRLRMACGLAQGAHVRLSTMTAPDALPLILRCTALPGDDTDMERRGLDNAARLASVIPWRHFITSLAPDAVIAAVTRELGALP